MAKPMVWLGKLSTDGRLFISMFCFSREGNPRKYPFPPTLRTTYYIPESLVQWSIDLFEVPCWGILFFAGWGSTCADNSIYFIKPPDEWWVVNPQAAVFPFRYRKVQATLVFNKTCGADWNFLCPASRAVSCTFFKTVHRQSTVLTYRRWDWQNADILKYLLLAIWTIVQIPTRLGSSWFTFHIFLVNSSPLLGIVQPRFLTNNHFLQSDRQSAHRAGATFGNWNQTELGGSSGPKGAQRFDLGSLTRKGHCRRLKLYHKTWMAKTIMLY